MQGFVVVVVIPQQYALNITHSGGTILLSLANGHSSFWNYITPVKIINPGWKAMTEWNSIAVRISG